MFCSKVLTGGVLLAEETGLMVQMPDSVLDRLWGLLDDSEKQNLALAKCLEFAAQLVPGSVIWVPDRISGAKHAGPGSHPHVVNRVDLNAMAVIAYLRTSRDEQGKIGCVLTPAAPLIGLNKPGYIVVRKPERLLLDDLIQSGCRVSGVLLPEYVEQIEAAQKQYIREIAERRRNNR